MRIVFVLLSFIFFLIFLIYRKGNRVKHIRNEIVIKARHQTVLAFREYFNNYISQLSEKELQILLVDKVKKRINLLSEEEILDIITTEFIKELIESRKFN